MAPIINLGPDPTKFFLSDSVLPLSFFFSKEWSDTKDLSIDGSFCVVHLILNIYNLETVCSLMPHAVQFLYLFF